MIRFSHAPDDSDPALATHLPDEAATLALGAQLAPALRSGLVIYLNGELGAGKTTLVRGVLRALGHGGNVKSPTYTLIEPYVVSRLNLYHFDFYRFTSAEEYLDAGLEEYFTAQGVCLVEWPQKAQPYVAPPDVVIELTTTTEGRDARIRPLTETGRQCTERLAAAPPPLR
ncbi:MAG: tRNA (adenosine(37)-N6)-threonylcarbamoyltransferase complex ATPase subunit type 1 TsaE [Rhodocyclaceae bacterium]|nr:tRNA (adenosine(37)-N6)-threonylcarbamoyltransferase complex ATPase subunit type 1 TsaE [Rhodocyclaceae bacterium]